MKKLLVSAIVSTSLASAAFAQPTSWTGPYVGAHVGYGYGESRANVSLGGDWALESQQLRSAVANGWSKDLKPDGPALGVQAGYNVQMPSKVVLGGEVSYSALDLSDSSSRTINPIGALRYALRNEIDVNNLIALRAKAGFALDRTLFYVTAGWAWSRAKMGAEVLSSGGYSKEGRISKTIDGYTLGLGVEHRFTQQLSLRMDYSFVDFGKETYATNYRSGSTFAPPGASYLESVSQDVQVHMINIGLNYHF